MRIRNKKQDRFDGTAGYEICLIAEPNSRDMGEQIVLLVSQYNRPKRAPTPKQGQTQVTQRERMRERERLRESSLEALLEATSPVTTMSFSVTGTDDVEIYFETCLARGNRVGAIQ